MGAEAFLPERHSLSELRRAAAGCRGCHLHERATQTVFGAGPRRSHLMLVGEQPGDVEDKRGVPFVGPAGTVLSSGLERAGIDPESGTSPPTPSNTSSGAQRGSAGCTRSRRRRRCELAGHGSRPRSTPSGPSWSCARGLRQQPRCWVPTSGVTRQCGAPLERDGLQLLATVHPSSILRAEDADARSAAMDAFVADLRRAAEVAGV